MQLLRGEHCVVFEKRHKDRTDDLRIVAGEDTGTQKLVSKSAVERALSENRTLVVADGGRQLLEDSSSDSMLLSGVRAVLCAPYSVRGRVAGCIYVTHGQVSNLFGPEEERLAQFIATLTGAALENAAVSRRLRN